jgi:hypothetical protein
MDLSDLKTRELQGIKQMKSLDCGRVKKRPAKENGFDVANRLKEALWNGAWDFHMNGIAPPPLDF